MAIRERAGVVARSSKRFVIPDILSAYRFCEFCEICGIDGQVQGVRARTTVRIVVSIRVYAGRGVGFPVPSKIHTGGIVFNLVCAVMDNKMQGDGGVGPVDVLIVSSVISGSGVNDAIPFVGFAGDGGEIIGGGVVDGQVKCVNLCAPVGIEVRVVVGAGLGIGTAIACCPCIGVERSIGDSSVRRIVDGQMQRHDTVATVAIRERAGVVAGSAERLAVPDILSAYRFCEFCEICGIDRQM